MVDIADLASRYEAALAAHYDNLADDKLRVAADKAATKLAAAREAERLAEGRPLTPTVVVDKGVRP
jgi:hypothetical protein